MGMKLCHWSELGGCCGRYKAQPRELMKAPAAVTGQRSFISFQEHQYCPATGDFGKNRLFELAVENRVGFHLVKCGTCQQRKGPRQHVNGWILCSFFRPLFSSVYCGRQF